MNKKILAAAVLAVVSGSAMADAQLYGILDVSAVSNSNGGTSGTQSQSLTGIADGTWLPSLWGMKGSEDLGDGMKANFQLESNLSSINGTSPNGESATSAGGGTSGTGKLFNRFATVGLSGDFGAFRVGEMLDPTFLGSVVEQARGVTHSGNLGLKMILSYGGAGWGNSSSSVAGVMSSNWIMYNSPKVGDVTFDAGYQAGNVSGSQSNGSGSFFGAHYTKNGLTLNASYQTQANSLNTNKLNKTLVGAMYTFGDFTVEGQVQSYRTNSKTATALANAANVDATGTQFGVAYNVTPKLQLSVQYDAVNDNLTTGTPRPTDLTIGVNYALSSRTHAYVMIENSQANGVAGWHALYTSSSGVATSTESAVAIGMYHTF